MTNRVVHFEVVGPDGTALKQFYAGVFGWQIDSGNPMDYGIVAVPEPGPGIGGGISASADGASSYATFYVAVDDPQATLDAAVAAGGSVVMGVTEIPDVVTLAQLRDPAGNLIGLIRASPPS